MKRDGWVKEANGVWILRFRYDWDSWEQNPKVLIDKGRLMSNGIPLLKSRKRMRRSPYTTWVVAHSTSRFWRWEAEYSR